MAKKNIVLLQTKYQINFFLKVKEREELTNILLIVPKEQARIAKISLGSENCFFYSLEPGYINPFKIRGLINNLRKMVEELSINQHDNLWIANDDHPVVQCLYNIVNFERVIITEDGLGSYVESSFMNYDEGLVAILKKIKKIFYFFPHYRAWFSVGANISGAIGYSTYDGSFPMQSNIEIRKIGTSHRRILNFDLMRDGSVIFVGQPLVEEKWLSQSQYLSYINYAFENSKGKDFIYVPHPRERNVKKIKEEGFEVFFNNDVHVEDYIYSSGKDLHVYGFFSTALCHVSRLQNVTKVVSLMAPGGIKGRGVKSIMRRFGVELKHFD
jgi:hypothetical protein